MVINYFLKSPHFWYNVTYILFINFGFLLTGRYETDSDIAKCILKFLFYISIIGILPSAVTTILVSTKCKYSKRKISFLFIFYFLFSSDSRNVGCCF